MGGLVFLLVLGLLLYLILSRSVESPEHRTVEVFLNTTAPVGHTDEHYVCATLDWWPPQKCDYGTCSWGSATLLNLDLSNKILSNAVKAFSPLKIRMGGTLQDRLVYQTDDQQPCNPFFKNNSQLLGFTQGCLSMSRWDELNGFFNDTGAVVTFGLNALTGRTMNPDGSATGAWDPTNAEALMRYTLSKGYNIHGWELGNELSGRGIGASVTAQQYSSDVKTLENLVKNLYNGSQTKPLVLGPGGFFNAEWFSEFISKTTKSLQAITYHIYNLGPGVASDLESKILNPSYLDRESSTFSNLQQIIRRSGTSAVAWVGEAGGAYNSGHNHVTNAFVMSFWYLDQLGMAATYDTKTYCRQTLVGGNYGLLNTNNFEPNPDYYSALLWHRLMGKQVLSASVSGMKMLRAYAHCSKQSEGITMLLLNLDAQTTFRVSISTETGIILEESKGPIARKSKFSKIPIIGEDTREEYHLSSSNGKLSSQRVLLNGRLLSVDSSAQIPALQLIVSSRTLSDQPIMLQPSLELLNRPCFPFFLPFLPQEPYCCLRKTKTDTSKSCPSKILRDWIQQSYPLNFAI